MMAPKNLTEQVTIRNEPPAIVVILPDPGMYISQLDVRHLCYSLKTYTPE